MVMYGLPQLGLLAKSSTYGFHGICVYAASGTVVLFSKLELHRLGCLVLYQLPMVKFPNLACAELWERGLMREAQATLVHRRAGRLGALSWLTTFDKTSFWHRKHSTNCSGERNCLSQAPLRALQTCSTLLSGHPHAMSSPSPATCLIPIS